MAKTTEPRLIVKIRKILDGLSATEGGLADISTADLDKAIAWAVANDGSLLVDLEDEVDFRQS